VREINVIALKSIKTVASHARDTYNSALTSIPLSS